MLSLLPRRPRHATSAVAGAPSAGDFTNELAGHVRATGFHHGVQRLPLHQLRRITDTTASGSCR